MAARVEKDKIVTITYRIVDEGGQVVEHNDVPVSYLHGGRSDLLEKIEQGLDGARAGDSVNIEVAPAEGFGEPDPDLTYTDSIENVPPEYRMVGAQAEFQNDRGEQKTFLVTKIENDQLTLDGNHPLAGKTVTFHVKVVQVRDATPQELAAGGPASPFGLDLINRDTMGRH